MSAKKYIGDVTVRELLPLWAKAYTEKIRAKNFRYGKIFSYLTIHQHFMLISRALRAKAFQLNLTRPELPFCTKELFPANWQGERIQRVRGDDEQAIRDMAARSRYSSRI